MTSMLRPALRNSDLSSADERVAGHGCHITFDRQMNRQTESRAELVIQYRARMHSMLTLDKILKVI